MKKITLTTGRLISYENPEEGFKKISSAGIDGLDFSLDMLLTSGQIEKGDFSGFFSQSLNEILSYADKCKEIAKNNNLEILQVHAPFQLYVYGKDEINNKCYEVLEKSFAFCSRLNVKYIVVHPINIAYTYGHEEEYRVNIEYYSKMIPLIKKYGVVVCLENMFSSINRVIREAVCSDVIETVKYIDTLNSMAGFEAFGFCVDVGHYQLLGKNMRKAITTLGNRIKVLHLHENDGISDNHGLPFMYTRLWGINPVIDWDEVLTALHDIGYQGTINFELTTGLMNIPEYARCAAMAYLKTLGEYFSIKITK